MARYRLTVNIPNDDPLYADLVADLRKVSRPGKGGGASRTIVQLALLGWMVVNGRIGSGDSSTSARGPASVASDFDFVRVKEVEQLFRSALANGLDDG